MAFDPSVVCNGASLSGPQSTAPSDGSNSKPDAVLRSSRRRSASLPPRALSSKLSQGPTNPVLPMKLVESMPPLARRRP